MSGNGGETAGIRPAEVVSGVRRPSIRLRPRGRFIFAALLLILILALLLGQGVLITARYHRSVAEGVLRDYAEFAAGELESRIQTSLSQRLFPILSLLAARGAPQSGTALPGPADLQDRLDPTIWRLIESSLAPFRLLPDDSLETSGHPFDAAAASRLADSLEQGLDSLITPRSYFGLLFGFGAGDQWVAVYTAGGEPVHGRRPLYGVVLQRSVLADILRPAVARAPLLPPTLTRGSRVDSAVVYRIDSPAGLLLQSGNVGVGGFFASRTLDRLWGGLRVETALRADLASRLIIGGLPRSRLPLVAALLLLTAGLIVAAGFQLRRERELSRLQEDFVAAVSHEFRTPLAQIRLFAETLRLGRVRNDAERDRSFEIIDQETRRLNHLVENLLYVSRIGRGLPAVTLRARDVAADLREAVEGFAPLAATRHARLELAAPARLEARADGDAVRQMTLNLLDNAIKYGPAGQTVLIRLEPRNRKLRLTVDDQGPGVPASDRRRIFQRFVRLERDREANTGGTGLGLALVQELAARHGGSAWVESAPSGGARFVVEWPGAIS